MSPLTRGNFKKALGLSRRDLGWERELYDLLEAMRKDQGPMLFSYCYSIIGALQSRMNIENRGILMRALALEIHRTFVDFEKHDNFWQLASLVLDVNILYCPPIKEYRTVILVVRNKEDLERRGWVILKDEEGPLSENVKIFSSLSADERKEYVGDSLIYPTDRWNPDLLIRIKDYLVGKYGRPSLDLLFKQRKFGTEDIAARVLELSDNEKDEGILRAVVSQNVEELGFEPDGEEYKEALRNTVRAIVESVINFLQMELDKLVS